MSPTKVSSFFKTPWTCPGQKILEFSCCHHQDRVRLSSEAGSKDPSLQLVLHPHANCKQDQVLTAHLHCSKNFIIFPDRQGKECMCYGSTIPLEPAGYVHWLDISLMGTLKWSRRPYPGSETTGDTDALGTVPLPCIPAGPKRQ